MTGARRRHSRLFRERAHFLRENSPVPRSCPLLYSPLRRRTPLGRRTRSGRKTQRGGRKRTKAHSSKNKKTPHPERPAPARRHHRLGGSEVHEEGDDRSRDGDDLAQEDSGHGGGSVMKRGVPGEEARFCSFQGCVALERGRRERRSGSDFEKNDRKRKLPRSKGLNSFDAISVPQGLARPSF